MGDFGLVRKVHIGLLWVEELERMLEMNTYDEEGIIAQSVERAGRRMIQFDILGLAENRPSVLRGDKVFLFLSLFFCQYSSLQFLFRYLLISPMENDILDLFGL